LPLLEALACGAVAVASDIPVHREVFASAVRLFPAGEVEALRQALQEVLEDTALRQRLRQAGLLLASRFTWEKAAQEHLRLWQEVACAPPRW
jgi:glycosyltransferase involved in cell wall biosynthesis